MIQYKVFLKGDLLNTNCRKMTNTDTQNSN